MKKGHRHKYGPWMLHKGAKGRKGIAMARFVKRPVEVEARRWTGDNFDELFGWGTVDGSVLKAKILQAGAGKDPTKLCIETLEGNIIASVDDWIIKGVKGEFYPCKPDIFDETYQRVCMENKFVAEGVVKDAHGQVFLETAPSDENVVHGYFADDLLEGFSGRRVRVTVEIIE